MEAWLNRKVCSTAIVVMHVGKYFFFFIVLRIFDSVTLFSDMIVPNSDVTQLQI